MTLSPDSDQLRAIMHVTGPAMVIAGPGSGKTYVITGRAAFLIESKAAAPDSILVITFTHAAAEAMRSRFLRSYFSRQERVSETPCMRQSTPVFGTFHSVFYSLLIQCSGFGKLSLASQAQSVDILRRLFDTRSPENSFTSDHYSNLLCDISRFKNGVTGSPSAGSELSQITAAYDKMMRGYGLFDFDDMLLECLKLLKRDRHVLAAVRRRFRFIMIDEFQDINRLQFEIVRLIAGEERNLFAVGDDDQSIYSFRGSEPEIMLRFGEYFPDAVYYTMFSNYRSQARIIQASSKLINNNRHRYKKQLKAIQPPDKHIYVGRFADNIEEAEYVTAAVKGMLISGYPPESVGILFRNHRLKNAVVRELAAAGLEKEAAEERIRLMTFHASKGLEFDAVFIIGANDGIVPGEGHTKDNTEEARTEEERRLFYVAMTRAKKYLHISNTKYVYNKKQKPSRFISEALDLSDRLKNLMEDLRYT